MLNELVGRISRGSKMDQIYIPKNRVGLSSGSLVIIKPLTQEDARQDTMGKHFLYGIDKIEPIKIEVISKIFAIVEKAAEAENIIISGSFLETGFCFNDIDALIISEKEIKEKLLREEIARELGINAHILKMRWGELVEGLRYDPLYIAMLSRCVAKKRLVFNIKRKINAQLLDLNLLKSRALIDNVDVLSGKEMYYLTKNMIAILMFIDGKKISPEFIDKEIKKIFKINAEGIKEKILEKNKFLARYKEAYKRIFKLIMKEAGGKNGPK